MNWASLDKNFPAWLLLVGGAALGWLKNFWTTIYNHTIGYLVRKLNVALTVEEAETEDPYVWLSVWAEKRIREKRITDLLLRRKIEREVVTYQAVPHYGTYFLRFRRRYLLVFTSSNEKGQPDSSGGATVSFFRPRRTIRISVWGTLRRSVITDLLDEAKKEFYDGSERGLLLYYNEGGWWQSREISTRPLTTVYLPSELADSIVNDAVRFMDSRDKYRMIGIPWRRGFLLYGPPGTGKSTLVQALATVLNLPIYFLNLSSVERPEELQRLFNSIGNRSIVLLEDVDCIPAARQRSDDVNGPRDGHRDGPKGIITSDLLNVIDGVVATEGRLLVLTTNHRVRLDEALLRKGRIDREFHLTWAREEELQEFHRRASTMFALQKYDEFRAMLPEQTTIADAQELLFGAGGEMVGCERLELPVLD